MANERPGPLQGVPSGPKASIRDKFEWLLNETFDAMTGNTSEAGLENIRLAAEVEELKGLLETEKMAVQRMERDLAAAQEQNRILARSPVLVSTWTAGAEQFRAGFEAALNGEQRWMNYSKAWYLGYDFQKGLPTHDGKVKHWQDKYHDQVRLSANLQERIDGLEKPPTLTPDEMCDRLVALRSTPSTISATYHRVGADVTVDFTKGKAAEATRAKEWKHGAEVFLTGYKAAARGDRRSEGACEAWLMGFDYCTDNVISSPAVQGQNQGYIDGRMGRPRNEYGPPVCNEEYRREYLELFAKGDADRREAQRWETQLQDRIAAIETDNAKLEKERDEARAYRDTLLANRASHKFAEEIGFSHGYREGVESAWGPGTPEEFIGDYRHGFRRGRIMKHRLHEETKAKEASQKLYESLADAIKQAASTIPPF